MPTAYCTLSIDVRANGTGAQLHAGGCIVNDDGSLLNLGAGYLFDVAVPLAPGMALPDMHTAVLDAIRSAYDRPGLEAAVVFLPPPA